MTAVRAFFARLLERLCADDPMPTYSGLDVRDGLDSRRSP